MNFFKILLIISLFFFSVVNYSQERELKKIIITGKVIDKRTNQPLEYATIAFVNTQNSKLIFGSITGNQGEFSVTINAGIYDLKVEFMSFTSLEIKQLKLFSDIDLGKIELLENSTQLQDAVVTAEKSTVEIKLDKKVYNVGKDMIVKGGTASDVLQNVPSVSVDADGVVSLRGNENVKILIDGRPSNAINIADALKTIPADALDKVEVITNPSARYDAEGGGGILNILLKKGKNNGLNGSATATAGNPRNYGLTGNINFKNENFNIFSNIGYIDNYTLGNSLTNSDFYDNGSYTKSVYEQSTMARYRNGFNFNFGFDWFLTKSLTWTNILSNRKNDGRSPQEVIINNVETGNGFIENRNSDQFTTTGEAEYSTNFTKKFKKEGQKLTIDATFTRNFDNDTSTITDNITGNNNSSTRESVRNFQTQYRNLLQTDFVLPINKNSQFEAGYRGNFINFSNDYAVGDYDLLGNYTPNQQFTNIFNYNEKINAFYLQFGTKINKFSFLFGARYENSNIEIDLISTNRFENKRYDNLFPSAFITYEITENTSLSLNYSKRIERPRSRFIAPFSNYSSNVNIFQGNPDINPSYTDAFDFGLLTKVKKITISSSIYYNINKEIFQFIRRPNGDLVGTTPVLISTPVNLDKELRYGLDLNINVLAAKWWKLNGNFNVFNSQISGNFSYSLNNSTDLIFQSVNKSAGSWFARLNSKVTLPFKIDWQTIVVYNASQNTAQGKSIGTTVINLAISKDILRDKGTITLNVNDLLNGQKMIREFNLPTIYSYSERQGRQRQINLSFTYRFNKLKTYKEKQIKKEEFSGGEY